MNRGAEGAALGGFFPSAAAVFMVSNVEPLMKGPGSLPGFPSAEGLQPKGAQVLP